MEEKDIELLKNSETAFIAKGSHILLALRNNEVVGCFSFLKISEVSFKLGQMAISRSYQGLQIGQKMLE